MWSRREPWLRSRRRSTCGRWQSTRRASSAFPTPAARICRYNFNLRLSKRRECNRPSPASPARFGDRLSILDHARQVRLNRIHGAGERCLFIASVGMDVWEIGERNKSFRPFAGQAYRILHHRNLTSGQWPSLFRSPCQFAILAVHGEHRFFCCGDEPADDRPYQNRNCIPVFGAIVSAGCLSQRSVTLVLIAVPGELPMQGPIATHAHEPAKRED